MTENDLRQAVVAQATAWLGCNEADGSHRVIIDLYNKYRPAGGYKMGYNDPWCATYGGSRKISSRLRCSRAYTCQPCL